ARSGGSIQPDCPLDANGRSECLAIRSALANLAHHIHALGHLAKRREALAVRVALTGEVQFRLVTDADEEILLRRVRTVARHRNRAVPMPQAGVARALERDG